MLKIRPGNSISRTHYFNGKNLTINLYPWTRVLYVKVLKCNFEGCPFGENLLQNILRKIFGLLG